MANYLGIFTAIILLVSAFVAMKNKARFEEAALSRDTASTNLESSQARLKAFQEELRAVPGALDEIEAAIAAKTLEENELKETAETLKTDIEDKTKRIAANKTQLDVVRKKTEEVGDVKNLAEKMRSMRSELEELNQLITSNEATLANLTSQGTAAQAQAARSQQELDVIGKGESVPSLNTRISNVYPSWGFVTLVDGNNAGVIANSTLDVVRNGKVIAKLLVTAVESRSSSASIVPGSMEEGVTLRSGDRVVPGRKSEAAAAN